MTRARPQAEEYHSRFVRATAALRGAAREATLVREARALPKAAFLRELEGVTGRIGHLSRSVERAALGGEIQETLSEAHASLESTLSSLRSRVLEVEGHVAQQHHGILGDAYGLDRLERPNARVVGTSWGHFLGSVAGWEMGLEAQGILPWDEPHAFPASKEASPKKAEPLWGELAEEAERTHQRLVAQIARMASRRGPGAHPLRDEPSPTSSLSSEAGDYVDPVRSVLASLEREEEVLARVSKGALAWRRRAGELAAEFSEAVSRGFRRAAATLEEDERLQLFLELLSNPSGLDRALVSLEEAERARILARLYRAAPAGEVIELAARVSRGDARAQVTLSPAFQPEAEERALSVALTDAEVARHVLRRVRSDPREVFDFLASLGRAVREGGPWLHAWHRTLGLSHAPWPDVRASLRFELARLPDRLAMDRALGGQEDAEAREALSLYLSTMREFSRLEDSKLRRRVVQPLTEVMLGGLGRARVPRLFRVGLDELLEEGMERAAKGGLLLSVTRFADWLLGALTTGELGGRRPAVPWVDSPPVVSGAVSVLLATCVSDLEQDPPLPWIQTLTFYLGRGAGERAPILIRRGLALSDEIVVEARVVRLLLHKSPAGSPLRELAVHDLLPRMAPEEG